MRIGLNANCVNLRSGDKNSLLLSNDVSNLQAIINVNYHTIDYPSVWNRRRPDVQTAIAGTLCTPPFEMFLKEYH